MRQKGKVRERPADLLHQTWLMTQEARVPIVLSNAQIEATDFGGDKGKETWGQHCSPQRW